MPEGQSVGVFENVGVVVFPSGVFIRHGEADFSSRRKGSVDPGRADFSSRGKAAVRVGLVVPGEQSVWVALGAGEMIRVL